MYFDSRELPPRADEYVAWIDVMGTKSTMSTSVQGAANYMFKLHIAALEAKALVSPVILYPVMDGLYASCPNKSDIVRFVKKVFESVAQEFGSSSNEHRFMIRAGLAYGQVYHGAALGAKASAVLTANKEYKESLLLGMPMIQAHTCESLAPPFGIYVHESARVFSASRVSPIHHVWLKWGDKSSAAWTGIQAGLADYLDWCNDRQVTLGYSGERILAHKKMVIEYFI